MVNIVVRINYLVRQKELYQRAELDSKQKSLQQIWIIKLLIKRPDDIIRLKYDTSHFSENQATFLVFWFSDTVFKEAICNILLKFFELFIKRSNRSIVLKTNYYICRKLRDIRFGRKKGKCLSDLEVNIKGYQALEPTDLLETGIFHQRFQVPHFKSD